MPVLHTTFVKSVNPGGRLYCGIDKTQARKNGEFGFLGEYIDGSHQIREFKAPTNPQSQGSKAPVVIMQPELFYDNSRTSLMKLANWENPANKAFVCVPLQEGDKFQITADAFNLRGVGATDALQVGKCFVLQNGRTDLTYTTASGGGGLPTNAGQVYFTIVDIKDAHARPARVVGDVEPNNYKLYTIEVRIKR